MNKKDKKEKKQTNNIRKYLQKNNSTEQKSCPPTAAKNQGKKKICTSLNDFFNCKEKTPSPPPTPKKMQLYSILKSVSIGELLEKCPKLQQLVTTFASKAGLSKDLIQMILKKYIQSHPNSLWSSKYAPIQISQLFSTNIAQKIMDWLNAFFQYKNKISEQDSFINEASQERSCKIYKNIKENQWQLLALIVRGRPGIGKTATIRAVAHQMDIDLHECGNDYNQTKYLKQKNESTQSESVKTAYSRKPKIEKNAQMITKFLPPIQKQKTKQSKKGQMIHNISIVYPESQSQKFYNQLSRCVQLSKIPFIMTNSGEKLPQVCQKYDIIEYQIEENQKIDKMLWVIQHLQNLNLINTTVYIQAEEVFEQINHQIQNVQFQQLCKISSIHEVCLLFNYRLDYILTFLQYHKKDLNEINTFPLLIQKYKNYNEDQLLQEILFIDFKKLSNSTPIKSKRQKKQQILCVSQQSTESQKNREIIEETHNELVLDSKQSPKKLFQYIKLLAIEDTISQKKQDLPFSKNSYDSSQWQNYPYTCIQIGIHQGIKKSLVKMANNEIQSSLERTKSTLKMQQLCYLPMLLKQKRANRTSRITNDTLKKVYDLHEFCYLEHFGNLIKPQ